MKVFVTGAAGFIGRAVMKELIAHGHSVVGLARSDTNVEIITAAGGTPLRGDVKDIESLKRGAEASDGVIHLAFWLNFDDFKGSCAVDRAAITAMAEAMEGTGKPLVIASGTLTCPLGVVGTEESENDLCRPPFTDRGLSSNLVHELSREKGIRGSVVRLAPTVYGDGEGGFVGMIVKLFREKGGPVIYVGDGSARWPACHRDDAAVLFRLALEKGEPASTFHGIAEGGVPVKDQMEMVARNLKLPLESKTPQEAGPILGFIGHVMMMDNPVTNEKTKKDLGWEPTRPGVIADFDAQLAH